MWTQLRASPGKGQDACCTTISSTHEAYVEFFGLWNSRFPRPPHMPARDSLRAWLAAPLSPSFRSFVGHEFTVSPGVAGQLHVFLRHPWFLLHFPFSLGNGGFFPRVSWPMPGSPPLALRAAFWLAVFLRSAVSASFRRGSMSAYF